MRILRFGRAASAAKVVGGAFAALSVMTAGSLGVAALQSAPRHPVPSAVAAVPTISPVPGTQVDPPTPVQTTGPSQEEIKKANLTVVATVVVDGTPQLRVYHADSAAEADQLRRSLANQPGVTEVTQDTPVTLQGSPDPYRPMQYGLDLLNIDSLPAGAATGAGRIVAVLDTGVVANHEDFAPGTVRCDLGADFASDAAQNDPAGKGCVDPHGHGSNVSGIIAAASGNGIGVEGTSAAQIMPVRVLDINGSGTAYGVDQGMHWAVDHGANVISMSLGGGNSSLYDDGVQYALAHNVTVVAAAGNDRTTGNAPNYPGATPGVIAVAAVDSTKTSAFFSYSGPTNDISAPGVSIVSLGRTPTSYSSYSGTSQATPFVSATVARYLGANPGATPAAVRAAINATATDIEASGVDYNTGYGLINPYKLLTGRDLVPYSAPTVAPTGLRATAGNGTVSLSWTAVAGTSTAPVSGYNIYRNGTALGSSTTPNYLDNTAVNGTLYSYTVTAYGPGGESPRSAAAAATPAVAPAAPAAPAGLKASVGSGTVTLSWTPVTGTAGAPVSGYRVYRNDALLGTVTQAGWGDTGLVNGTGYTYAVAAYGTGGESAKATVTATPVRLPASPVGLAATAGNGRVTLSWTAVGSTAAAPVTGYNVYRNGTQLGSSTTPSYVDTTAQNWTTYSYTVSAVGTAGESARSTAISSTPVAPPVAPAVPAGLRATAGNGQATLTWTAVAGTAAAPVSGYKVYRNGTVVRTVSTPAYTDTGLVNGTTYGYTVTAYGAGGESAQTAPVTAKPTAPLVAPAAPTKLQVVAGNNSVTLGWTATAPTTSAPVSGYRIYRNATLIGSTTTTSYVDRTATNGTSYTYAISAYGDGGESTRATSASIRPAAPPVAPAIPSGFKTVVGNQMVTLSWTAVVSSDAAPVTGYKVYRNGTLLITTTATSLVDRTVANGTAYRYAISTYGNGGESAQTSTALATPYLPLSAPPAPSSVRAVAGAGQVTLSWVGTAGTSTAPLSGYRIYRKGILLATSTSTSYVDKAVSNLTTYSYTVSAYGNGGESPRSTAVSARPAAAMAVPAAPTGLLATSGTGLVAISWTAVPGVSTTAPGGYYVYRNGVRIATTTTPSFVDRTGVRGIRYTYAVSAYSSGGESRQSVGVAAASR